MELHNYGDKELSLASFTLSDDPAKTDKWMFPAVTIPAGGYQVVYLSGKAKAYTAGGPLHADFVLSGKEPSLTLYAADGKKVDDCTVNDLTSNLVLRPGGAGRGEMGVLSQAHPRQGQRYPELRFHRQRPVSRNIRRPLFPRWRRSTARR